MLCFVLVFFLLPSAVVVLNIAIIGFNFLFKNKKSLKHTSWMARCTIFLLMTVLYLWPNPIQAQHQLNMSSAGTH